MNNFDNRGGYGNFSVPNGGSPFGFNDHQEMGFDSAINTPPMQQHGRAQGMPNDMPMSRSGMSSSRFGSPSSFGVPQIPRGGSPNQPGGFGSNFPMDPMQQPNRGNIPPYGMQRPQSTINQFNQYKGNDFQPMYNRPGGMDIGSSSVIYMVVVAIIAVLGLAGAFVAGFFIGRNDNKSSAETQAAQLFVNSQIQISQQVQNNTNTIFDRVDINNYKINL